MRLTRFTARNVKRIREIDFDLDGNALYLVGGRNRSGKTSCLQAILATLTGARDFKLPDPIIREGEDEAETLAILEPQDGDEFPRLEIRLRIKRAASGKINQTLTITDPEGREYKKPREVLGKLYETSAFDPRAFEDLSPDDQAKTLAKLVGIDFEAFDKRIAEAFAERKLANRDVAHLKAACSEMPVDTKLAAEEVSVSELLKIRDSRQAKNQQIEDLRDEEEDAKSAIEIAERKIKQIKEQLTHAESQLMLAEERLDKIQDAIIDIGEAEDTAGIDRQIAEAETTNAKIRDNNERRKTAASLKAAEVVAKKLDKQLDAIKAERLAEIQAATWPVDGLSIEEGTVLYRGLPFRECSRAERIGISCRIMAALKPQLRLIVSEHGSDLDDDAIESLDAFLRESGFSAIFEVVTRGDADRWFCSVVLSEGEAVD